MTTLEVRSQVGHSVRRLRDGKWAQHEDVLAAEEPLETRLIWKDGRKTVTKSIAITMRTPGHDFELATGFLYGEGIISSRDDVADVSYCTDEDEDQAFNIVTVTLRPGLVFDASRLERNFYTTSCCGVCGKAALDALEVQGCNVLPDGLTVAAATCLRPAREAARRPRRYSSAPAACTPPACSTATATLLSLQEDVGRHNAVDKLIGERFLADALPLTDSILMLSGRASFELLQKALVARIPVVAAVGAPSSLAVQLAESFNITLCGFVKADALNVYSAPQRVLS